MDTAAVKRGLSSIRAGFSRLGGMMRGLGGLMKKSLLPVVAILGGLAVAFKKVAEEGSELSDMEVQTGVAVKDLVLMKEALRMAGAPIKDTSRMLSMMAANIQEARFQSGMARDALVDMLGIDVADIQGLRMDEQFKMILERIRDAGDELPRLEMAMEGIFGARMGFGILRLAKDLDVNWAKAAKSSENYGKFMGANAQKLDSLADSLGRIGMLFKEVTGRLLMLLPIEKIADAIQNFNITPIADFLGAFLQDPFGKIMDGFTLLKEKVGEFATAFVQVLLDKADEIGKKIGGAIMGGLGKIGRMLAPEDKERGWLGKLFLGPGPLNIKSKSNEELRKEQELLDEAKRQNELLKMIQLGGAIYA